MIGGIPITKKQRYLAGRTDLVALLRSRGETLKKLGSEWEWKFHDERVTIRGHLWFDQYTQKGGDAVDFFRYFYGESEEQAAAVLLNCSVADLEKLPARSPPNLPRPSKKSRNSWQFLPLTKICGGCLLTCARPGASPQRWCPPLRERGSSTRAPTTTTLFLWAGTSTARSATSTTGGPSPAPPFVRPFQAARRRTVSTGKGSAGNCTPLKHPSICCPTFLCTRRDGRTTPMWPCAGSAQPPSTTYWKRNPSCRTSPCAWTMTKLDTTLPAGSPANCCGNGTSLCPLNFPVRRTGTMSCSPFARRKAKG